MTKVLDAEVATFAGRVGITRACSAFGVKPRSYRHRRQAREGRLLLRKRPASKPRTPHPSALQWPKRSGSWRSCVPSGSATDTPAQAHTTSLDEGTYLCSVRQIYRRRTTASYSSVVVVDTLAAAFTPFQNWKQMDRTSVGPGTSPNYQDPQGAFATTSIRFWTSSVGKWWVGQSQGVNQKPSPEN